MHLLLRFHPDILQQITVYLTNEEMIKLYIVFSLLTGYKLRPNNFDCQNSKLLIEHLFNKNIMSSTVDDINGIAKIQENLLRLVPKRMIQNLLFYSNNTYWHLANILTDHTSNFKKSGSIRWSKQQYKSIGLIRNNSYIIEIIHRIIISGIVTEKNANIVDGFTLRSLQNVLFDTKYNSYYIINEWSESELFDLYTYVCERLPIESLIYHLAEEKDISLILKKKIKKKITKEEISKGIFINEKIIDIIEKIISQIVLYNKISREKFTSLFSGFNKDLPLNILYNLYYKPSWL
jgi:hypothetical protein